MREMQLTPLYLVEESLPAEPIPRVVHELVLRAVAIYSPVTPAQRAAIATVLLACVEGDFGALIEAMDSAAEFELATNYWRSEWSVARLVIRRIYMRAS